jgi:hypothetical protein
VGKETIFGLLKALEIFVNQDLDETTRTYDNRAQVITDAVAKFGVTALPRQYNPQALGNVTPYYSWRIDPLKIKITGQEVMQKLAETQPLAIGALGANAGGLRGRDPGPEPNSEKRGTHHAHDPATFGFTVWQLKKGEDRIIADRLTEIFSGMRNA